MKVIIIGLVLLFIGGCVIATTMENNTDDIIVVEDIIIEPTPTPEPTVELTLEEQTLLTDYPDEWQCYDFAMNWTELHPEWGMVTISKNSRFKGLGHIVNFLVTEDKSLYVVSFSSDEDGVYGVSFNTISGDWNYDGEYAIDFYHFYMNGEIPTRRFNSLTPNAEVFYNEL